MLRTFSFLFLALFATPVGAAVSLDSLLQALERKNRSVVALEGEFVQKNRMKLFKQELSSKGRFSFKKPRSIVWEYLEPDPSKLELVDKKATLSTPGAAPQVFDLEKDQTMRTVFDQILLWFGAGALGDAQKSFTMSTAGSDAAPVLVLLPKAGEPVAKAFKTIELTFDGKTSLLKKIHLVEPSGDDKEITFTSTRQPKQ